MGEMGGRGGGRSQAQDLIQPVLSTLHTNQTPLGPPQKSFSIASPSLSVLPKFTTPLP